MLLRSLPVLAVAATLLISSVQANEPFPAGGIVIDPSAEVVVAKEDVYLSVRQVRVSYVYESATAQTVAMGFPMPIVPIDGGPDHLGSGTAPSDHTNYAAATVTVDGKTVTPKAREFAYFNGVDITEELAALGIPAYVPDGETLKSLLAGADVAKVDDLVRREIIYRGSYGDPEGVNWQYQSVLEWDQELAAGTTQVELTYEPMNGYPGDVNNAYFGEGSEEDVPYIAEVRAFYCIDDALLKALNKKRAEGAYFDLVWTSFAPSAEEKARPVKAFSLVVDKRDTAEWSSGDMDYVSFCPIDAKKIAPLQFEWKATDFRPRDFNLVYYAHNSGASQ